MSRNRLARLALVGLLLASVPALARKPPADPAPCLYGMEWLHTYRFPLQPDPHAAYSYVAPSGLHPHVGFLVDAEFPYAAWFSWTIYGENAIASALVSDAAVEPDDGSTNPFVSGEPVLAPDRSYRLLLLPEGAETVAPSLADIPSQNWLTMPSIPGFALAYRVYQAFPGYLLGGSGGPTNTPFPSVYAVDYTTGKTLDCTKFNAIPTSIGRLPSDTPNVFNIYGTSTRAPGARATEVHERRDVEPLLETAWFGELQSKIGWQFAPLIAPELVTFTRPPLAAGADVSSIPPPDNCSGYLGARVDPRRIALIRVPHVATTFDVTNIDSTTTYPDVQGAHISLTMYGAAVNRYLPGDPETGSLADLEFLPDATGGSTIVVWPRDLKVRERRALFDYARAHGWALIRGGEIGPLTTANMLFRLKGANPDYYGAYTPNENRTGVPCYFDDPDIPLDWTEIANADDPMLLVASFRWLGNAAPQGVHCRDTRDVLDGSCLERLKTYIQETGGKYFNPGDVPPP